MSFIRIMHGGFTILNCSFTKALGFTCCMCVRVNQGVFELIIKSTQQVSLCLCSFHLLHKLPLINKQSPPIRREHQKEYSSAPSAGLDSVSVEKWIQINQFFSNAAFNFQFALVKINGFTWREKEPDSSR